MARGGRNGEEQSLVMAIQHRECPECHQTVHLKIVIFMICEFYLKLKEKKGNPEMFPLLLVLGSEEGCQQGSQAVTWESGRTTVSSGVHL